MIKELVRAKAIDEDEQLISFDLNPAQDSAKLLVDLEEESAGHLRSIFGEDYHNDSGVEYVDSEHGQYYLVG